MPPAISDHIVVHITAGHDWSEQAVQAFNRRTGVVTKVDKGSPQAPSSWQALVRFDDPAPGWRPVHKGKIVEQWFCHHHISVL